MSSQPPVPPPPPSLPDVEHDPSRFANGAVSQVHRVGDLGIVEFQHRVTQQPGFWVYLNNRDTGRSANTLDAALIEALAVKYDGPQTQTPFFISTLINLSSGIHWQTQRLYYP